ncbi:MULTISPECIES: DUF6627 family protein [unclassified Ectothiorhodospira]|jgi:hypothetical protein|uniref:DUF6627 family protein n=1 Tax=unclassified Ectothiorhodospira TaxID=2684909 RepID=UPI001EE8CD0F|nr:MULTISPECIES: DUF6627 family protein [unclassified Ectothiorhodospira]MCG5515044.1 PA2779 family protein [Ectothiorhodospira sp. 9100]MCG5517762.1 PA2779 family protein [Ectothiorhodospira sp. 9905]
MKRNPLVQRLIALVCIVALLAAGTAPLHASMVGTDQLILSEQAQVDREQLLATLERDDVREQLSALGVDPSEAAQRVARMTDQEVRELNERIEDMPVGSASVLGVVVLIFIVFIITDAIGATDIFPFVRPVN